MNLVMGLRSVVEPQEVKKTWVNRECLFADIETVSNKLATLGIKHCMVINEWGNIKVYVPAKHLYNLIGIINS